MPIGPQDQAKGSLSKLPTDSNSNDKSLSQSTISQQPLNSRDNKHNVRQREAVADNERLEAALRYTEAALARPAINEDERYRTSGWVYVSKKKQGQDGNNRDLAEQR